MALRPSESLIVRANKELSGSGESAYIFNVADSLAPVPRVLKMNTAETFTIGVIGEL